MSSTQGTARQAGALCFLFMVIAIFGEFFSPATVVPGDAAATAVPAALTGLTSIQAGQVVRVEA